MIKNQFCGLAEIKLEAIVTHFLVNSYRYPFMSALSQYTRFLLESDIAWCGYKAYMVNDF